MDSQTWATIFGAGGLGAILLALVKGVIDWLNGSHARERDKNVDILTQRNDAWKERDSERTRANRERDRADREASRRRQVAEYASHVRAVAIRSGIDPSELPLWPDHFIPTVNPDRED